MSFQEIENLSKADLKNKLSQMGMSLDREDHPRDYYAQLYLEKSNAKNKITRDNTPFYNNRVLRRKSERVRISVKAIASNFDKLSFLAKILAIKISKIGRSAAEVINPIVP